MDKHLESLKKPYTCRSTVKYIEEACFLASIEQDVGEAKMDQVWEADDEPEPSRIDYWAANNVKVNRVPMKEKVEEQSQDYEDIDFLLAQTSGTPSIVSKSPKRKGKKLKKGASKAQLEDESEESDEKEQSLLVIPLDVPEQKENNTEEIQRMRNEKDRQEANRLQIQMEKEEREKRLKELEEIRNQNKGNDKDKKSKNFTFDHNGHYLPVNRVNTARLPGRNSLGYEIRDPEDSPNDKSKKKKKRRKRKQDTLGTGINPELIFHNSERSESEFIEHGNDFPPAAADAIDLQAGVKIQEGGRTVEGPNMDRKGRMTLDEYFVVAEKNKVRYDKKSPEEEQRSLEENASEISSRPISPVREKPQTARQSRPFSAFRGDTVVVKEGGLKMVTDRAYVKEYK